MDRETGSVSYKPLEDSQSLTLRDPTHRKQVSGHPNWFSNQSGKSQPCFFSNYSWQNMKPQPNRKKKACTLKVRGIGGKLFQGAPFPSFVYLDEL